MTSVTHILTKAAPYVLSGGSLVVSIANAIQTNKTKKQNRGFDSFHKDLADPLRALINTLRPIGEELINYVELPPQNRISKTRSLNKQFSGIQTQIQSICLEGDELFPLDEKGKWETLVDLLDPVGDSFNAFLDKKATKRELSKEQKTTQKCIAKFALQSKKYFKQWQP